MVRLTTSAETAAAWRVLRRFVAEADRRPPHVALDSLLTIAERMEIEQGGRLTEFQARTFAAFLLGAEQLPADAVDPDIVPQWFSPADEARYADGQDLIAADAASSALQRH
jgi:hypothetical protein